jgi:hypothetical protein
MFGNVEPLDDTPDDALDRIRRCGTIDTEFFEWAGRTARTFETGRRTRG